MLQLTHAAAAQLTAVRQAQGQPDTVGLRVSGRSEPGGGLAVELRFSETPAEQDAVTEQEGMLMFVSPEVAGPLSSSALDVEETHEGVQLVLTQQ